MLNLPKNTFFGKRIPKQKFYENLKVNTELKRVFIEQIEQITWQYKIASTTVNLPEGKMVKEIEVLLLKLNQKYLDKEVLMLMDKEIPYHLLCVLEYAGEIQIWVAYKEEAKNTAFQPSAYYHTEWLKPESLKLTLEGLDLDKVYENFIRQIANERLDANTIELKEAIQEDARKQKLIKQIASLEKKIEREKQFNRQVELNKQLKQLKQDLEN